MGKETRNRKWILWVSLFALALSSTVGLILIKGSWPYEITLLGAGILFACLLVYAPNLFHGKETSGKNGNKAKTPSIFLTKEGQKKFFFRACAIIFFSLFVTRYVYAHDYVESVSALTSEFMGKFAIGSGAILACYESVIVIYIVASVFYPTKETDAIMKWMVSPILVLIMAFYPNVLRALVGDISVTFSVRGILLSLEVGFGISFAIKSWISDPSLKLDKSQGYAIFVSFVLLAIVSINDYLPKNLFGEKIQNIPTAKNFSWTHRIFIYLTFLFPVFYFKLLYPFDLGHRRYFLFVISAGVLFSYAVLHRYEMWTHLYSLPLHLCNTAMYLMPLTLSFKNRGLFYFTMFVNVIGAFFALLMPNFSDALLIFGSQTFEFFINHMYATFFPVLIILLGVYERPKNKYFVESMGYFLLYFVLVATIDIYYAGQGNTGVDFFFLQSDYIPDKLGDWAENIYRAGIFTFTNGGFTYTVRLTYLISFFLVYVLLSLFMWFLYGLLFSLVDEGVTVSRKSMDRKRRKDSFKKESGHGASLLASHVSKTYPGNESPSLIDFSLSLKPGKIYGFLGNNGAGKSTFIKACVGLHDFEKGSIKICGYDITYESKQAKNVMAYVPDHYALEENLTGKEYLNYMADLYKVGATEREERIDKYLSLLHLEDAYNDLLLTYSHGMKQKITLLGALIHNPSIIILDEPLTGVDPQSVYEIKKVLLGLAKESKIVFFSSHMIDVVLSICDEVIIIKDGQYVDSLDLGMIIKKKLPAEEILLANMNTDKLAPVSLKKEAV